MKKYLPTFFLLVSMTLGLSCGGSDHWTKQPYDVTADATLDQVLADLAALSGVAFTIEPELKARMDEEGVDLPTLLGLNAGEVLTLIQDSMLPETEFFYEELSDGSILLRTRFQERADQTGADPITIIEFDDGLGAVTALISDPAFDEECDGDEEETVLQLLGSGGVFGLVTEVDSDEGGHAEFIGEFPPEVELQIEGNELAVVGAAPWVDVFGTIEDDGSFTCSGSGIVAGFPDVQVDFLGQAAPEGISGTLTVGADGALPGGTSVIYSVNP